MKSLDLTLLFLFTAVLGGVVFRTLRLPPILAYLSAGVLIGPYGLNWVGGSAGLQHLAEFGVVFLMLVIGLEFSLGKLKRNMRFVLGLGGLQVAGMMLVFCALSLLLAWALPFWWNLDWRSSLAVAGALSLSSTAIVGKMMSEQQELDTEHGQRVLAVLLFQDLAVVPLLVLIPALGSPPEVLFKAIVFALLKASLIIALLLIGGQWLMQRWLRLIARRKSEELFMLNLLLMTLGLAWLTEHFGLSLALGAFIAGMLISETEFKHRVEAEIKPFYDLLLGLFFITIGMLLDWRIVLDKWILVLGLTLIPMLLKLVWVSVLAKLMGATAGVSLRTGIYLAQMGEFGFVLITLALANKLIPAEQVSPILAAIVLSMLLTPFMLLYSNPLVRRIIANDWMTQSLQMTGIVKKSLAADEHVIICGFGRSGQNMARLLTSQGIAYLALDTDPDLVRQASAAGDNVVYGDASKPQTLVAAGLGKAKTVAITNLDSKTSLKILAAVREKNAQIDVVVRTRDDHDIDALYAAGATEIVPEAIEGSLMLTSQVLALQGLPIRQVLRTIQSQREARYSLLRGFFHSNEEHDTEDLEDEHLLNLVIEPDTFAVGQTLHNLALRTLSVRVVVLRRKGGEALSMPEAQTVVAVGDTLLLSGKPEALELAQERVVHGK